MEILKDRKGISLGIFDSKQLKTNGYENPNESGNKEKTNLSKTNCQKGSVYNAKRTAELSLEHGHNDVVYKIADTCG